MSCISAAGIAALRRSFCVFSSTHRLWLVVHPAAFLLCGAAAVVISSGTFCVFITTIAATQQSFVYNVTAATGDVAARVPLNGSAWNVHLYKGP